MWASASMSQTAASFTLERNRPRAKNSMRPGFRFADSPEEQCLFFGPRDKGGRAIVRKLRSNWGRASASALGRILADAGNASDAALKVADEEAARRDVRQAFEKALRFPAAGASAVSACHEQVLRIWRHDVGGYNPTFEIPSSCARLLRKCPGGPGSLRGFTDYCFWAAS